MKISRKEYENIQEVLDCAHQLALDKSFEICSRLAASRGDKAWNEWHPRVTKEEATELAHLSRVLDAMATINKLEVED